MKKLILFLPVLLISIAAHAMDDKSKQKKGTPDIVEMMKNLSMQPKDPNQDIYHIDLTKTPATHTITKAGESSNTNASTVHEKKETITKEPVRCVSIGVQTDDYLMPSTRAYFNSEIKRKLLKCINREQEAIYGVWYRFTLHDVAEAIVKKMKTDKIKVGIIVDKGHLDKEFCSPLKMIIEAGGIVRVMDKKRFAGNKGNFESLHDKFMLFQKNKHDKSMVLNGSWNATGQADKKNTEASMITDDENCYGQFAGEYIEIKKYTTKLTAEQCVTPRDKETGHIANFSREMNGIPKI